jgi:hypothetical protein
VHEPRGPVPHQESRSESGRRGRDQASRRWPTSSTVEGVNTTLNVCTVPVYFTVVRDNDEAECKFVHPEPKHTTNDVILTYL